MVGIESGIGNQGSDKKRMRLKVCDAIERRTLDQKTRSTVENGIGEKPLYLI